MKINKIHLHLSIKNYIIDHIILHNLLHKINKQIKGRLFSNFIKEIFMSITIFVYILINTNGFVEQ